MSGPYSSEPMLDVYLFETSQNIEQLESAILSCEKTSCFTREAIDEIFRIMHTIKGSSAMMLFNNLAALAHSMEDLFYFLREQKPKSLDCSILSDLVLEGVDFIKVELHKIKSGEEADGDCSAHTRSIREFLARLKQENAQEPEAAEAAGNPLTPTQTIPAHKEQYYIKPGRTSSVQPPCFYKAVLRFVEGCEMENIRAYTVIHNLKEMAEEIEYTPEDIIDDDSTAEVIRAQGFTVYLKTDRDYEQVRDFFHQTLFLKDLELVKLETDQAFRRRSSPRALVVEDSPIKVPRLQSQDNMKEPAEKDTANLSSGQSMISVHVAKLDGLMNLVGEMVIAEAMVTQNPDLKGLELENFRKAARQLHKITNEIQDMVMSIRMVPLSVTFHKMHRIVRDMSKKLGKEVGLELIGEDTEVDKNIIEHISDPLMHLIRNAIDHGIEAAEDRVACGKPEAGTLTLEAKNEGSDVLVVVRDDGRGLNRKKILQKARENKLLIKDESEMTERDIFSLILLPGFSTKDTVSEFSGRGVGMDVVSRNLEAVGGAIMVDSREGCGTTVTLKIPLTLAIIDGMNIKVGNSRYTLPTTSIKESFKPVEKDLLQDPDGNEMIMVRGQCYPILRLHEHFKVETAVRDFIDGILVMVEQDERSYCIFADQLLGQQQVVVKALPSYIKHFKKIGGVAGCTLLGDGSISLILDAGGLIQTVPGNQSGKG